MYIEKIENEKYQLKKEQQSIGTFKIVQLTDGAGKLEQLQVASHISPGQVLQIFEVIQLYMEAEGFKKIHVESHSDTLDFLLQHQQFELVDVEKRLWIYTVNHR